MSTKIPLKQLAYELISEKIINCEYAPNSFLNEQMLSDELNISRTPIRDALIRLQQNNLVQIFPKKGIVVTEVTPEVISSVYEIRTLIEPYIVRTCGDEIDKEQLSVLKNEIEEGIQSGANEIHFDDNFHLLITQACHNRYIQDSIRAANIQNRRIRVIAGESRERLENSHKQHLEIIDKILEDKYEDAAILLSKHLDEAKLVALDTLIDKWR
ncbi:MAG: GntR family transcriptional regulator [Sphaerochaeta sp.]